MPYQHNFEGLRFKPCGSVVVIIRAMKLTNDQDNNTVVGNNSRLPRHEHRSNFHEF